MGIKVEQHVVSRTKGDAAIARVEASTYVVPTDRPEADGTFEWSSTTMVVAEAEAMGQRGIGYSYTGRAAAAVIADTLGPALVGVDAMDTTRAWLIMQRAVRNQGRDGICASAIAAVDITYFRRMLEAEAVDVLQADATRCAGITGFLEVGALCDAFTTPLSAHTAPALHLAVCCAVPAVRHLEYFHDHVRIERLFFDGVATPRAGQLAADRDRPGLGIELKRADAAQYRVG